MKTIQIFRKKCPNVFRFISNRLSPTKFKGLSLTILTISIVSNLFLLFDFIEDTINSKEFIKVDNLIANFFFSIRNNSIANFFYYFSKFCSLPVVIISGTIMSIYFLIKRKLHFIAGISISILGSGISIFLGKSIFEVDRPHHYAYYNETNFSFPSGHATIVVAFYGLIFYLLIKNSSSVSKWIGVIFTALFFWILIGIGRLYLCVHYFSDIIGGYILGFLWLLLSISIIKWQEHKR